MNSTHRWQRRPLLFPWTRSPTNTFSVRHRDPVAALRARMLSGFCFPEQLPRLRIDRVDSRQHVGEVNGVLRRALTFDGSDDWGCANAGISAERPVDATGLRVERIEPRGIASEEDSARGDGGLGVHFGGVGNSKGPLELKAWNLLSSKACMRRMSESACC